MYVDVKNNYCLPKFVTAPRNLRFHFHFILFHLLKILSKRSLVIRSLTVDGWRSCRSWWNFKRDMEAWNSVLHGRLHDLFVWCWKQSNLPRGVRNANTVTTLPTTGGFLTRVLLNNYCLLLRKIPFLRVSVASESTGLVVICCLFSRAVFKIPEYEIIFSSISYLPTPPLGQDMTQCQFLSGV